MNLNGSDYTKIRKIIESGWVSIGKNVEALEGMARDLFSVKHVVGCSCATQGLIIALKASGWKDMRIAVPAFTWPSTVYAIESCTGNTPVFCDIDRETWLIDLKGISLDDYDAIMPVDVFGNRCPIYCYDKPVIYDAAHGFGLEFVGNRGIAEVISLSFTKIATAGEGGLILTNDQNVYETAVELRRLSARMGEVNALIGLNSIKNYSKNKEKRSAIVEFYEKNLQFDYKKQKIPDETNNSVFSILVEPNQREHIVSAFRLNDIEVKTYYEPLVRNLKNTEWVYSRIISLPIYPSLKKEEQARIINVMNFAVENCKHNPGINYLKKSGYIE
jgi:dTDP-4-amino-4,6-dideoxygalactose transaminase